MRALFTKRELVTFGVHWQERPGGEHRCEVLVRRQARRHAPAAPRRGMEAG